MFKSLGLAENSGETAWNRQVHPSKVILFFWASKFKSCAARGDAREELSETALRAGTLGHLVRFESGGDDGGRCRVVVFVVMMVVDGAKRLLLFPQLKVMFGLHGMIVDNHLLCCDAPGSWGMTLFQLSYRPLGLRCDWMWSLEMDSELAVFL